MREINQSVIVNELPNGFFQIESTGAVLSPEQFEKLQEVDQSTLYIVIVDVDLQKQRTYEAI